MKEIPTKVFTRALLRATHFYHFKGRTFENFKTVESEEMGRNVAFIEPVDEVLVVQPPKPNTTAPQNAPSSSSTTETPMEIDGTQVINSPRSGTAN